MLKNARYIPPLIHAEANSSKQQETGFFFYIVCIRTYIYDEGKKDEKDKNLITMISIRNEKNQSLNMFLKFKMQKMLNIVIKRLKAGNNVTVFAQCDTQRVCKMSSLNYI